jgi:DNA polymerase III subunit epsilon
MDGALLTLPVLALDCQAAGASPAYGDLIELGWAVCTNDGVASPVHSRWIVPRTDRPIRRPIRELTGWSEACLAESVEEHEVWRALREEMARIATPAPAVIHFARFELSFLRDLHERSGGGEFPLDAICLHAVAARLFPDLPRRNIRALAGYLGFSPSLVRRSAGHVEATAFIWHALLPLLEQAGVTTWSELKAWLERSRVGARSRRRQFPLAAERRRSLPDGAGIYRFVRKNGDVVYVGKARSLKKRVAGHFKSRGPTTERGLELLSQVHDVQCTETASLLEAALLETDEIKRLDPPYNVQLRSGSRSAWFVSRDLEQSSATPDDVHRIGPLPSERALFGLGALIALAAGAAPTPGLMAGALAVPVPFLPERGLFDEGYRCFAADWLRGYEANPERRVRSGSRVLWLERGRAETESAEDAPPDEWDLARVRRRLERNLVQSGLLVRRARVLALIADADVAFREPGATEARALVISRGEVIDRSALPCVAALRDLPLRRPRCLGDRQSSFDAATYDRLRVLLTELRRIHDAGGEVAVRIGRHMLQGLAMARVMRTV